MIIQLTSTGIYAKPSAEVDYQLTPESSPEIPQAVTLAIASWLQTLINSSSEVATGLHHIDGTWWLFRVQMEQSTDSSNRRRGIAFFGRVVTELAPENAVALVEEFCRTPLSRQKPLPTEIFVEPVPHRMPNPETAAAILLLAIGMKLGNVKAIADAASVLSTLPITQFNWIGFFPIKSPLTVPAGSGFVINENSEAPPRSVRALVEKSDAIAILRLPLAQLMLLPDAWEVRLKLVEAAAGLPAQITEASISHDALWWLAGASPIGRQIAAQTIGSNRASEWLASNFATADDLAIFASSLGADHREVCYRLVSNRSDGFQLYAKHFPDDLERLWKLLPEHLHQIDSRLSNPQEELSSNEIDEYFNFIAGTAIENMEINVLANAARSGSSIALERFARQLEDSGLNQPLVYSLIYGHVLELTDSPPALQPKQEWIQGIDDERWLQLGRQSMSNKPWRKWWLSGWPMSFRRGRIDSKRLLAEAITSRHPDALRQASASEEICILADRDARRVTLMSLAGTWDVSYNPLIEAMFADNSLFFRIDDELDETFIKFLESCLTPESASRLHRICTKLGSTEPVDSKYLSSWCRNLTRRQRLYQVGAWYQSASSVERGDTIRNLIKSTSNQLQSDEVDFFTAAVFSCQPWPRVPFWTAAELICMLPLIGPVEVIRQVMVRSECEPDERLLLDAVLRSLSVLPNQRPLPVPTRIEQERRPAWFNTLKQHIPWWRTAGDSGRS